MQKVKLSHQVLSYTVCKMLMWNSWASAEVRCSSKDADAVTFERRAVC